MGLWGNGDGVTLQGMGWWWMGWGWWTYDGANYARGSDVIRYALVIVSHEGHAAFLHQRAAGGFIGGDEPVLAVRPFGPQAPGLVIQIITGVGNLKHDISYPREIPAAKGLSCPLLAMISGHAPGMRRGARHTGWRADIRTRGAIIPTAPAPAPREEHPEQHQPRGA